MYFKYKTVLLYLQTCLTDIREDIKLAGSNRSPSASQKGSRDFVTAARSERITGTGDSLQSRPFLVHRKGPYRSSVVMVFEK